MIAAAIILTISWIIVVIFFATHEFISEKELKEQYESAFFLGQYTAIKGDWRINTSNLQWAKSPWPNNEQPIFKYGESELGKKVKKQIEKNEY